MQMDNVIERLRNYVKDNPEMAKNGFIKGLDPETKKVVIIDNGEKKFITIDELENWNSNQTPQEEKIEVIDEVPSIPSIPNEQVEIMIEDEQPNEEIETLDTLDAQANQIVTLKDMQEAIISKNEVAINKALETFALDEKTGTININKAIKTVTDNSVNNVVNCIRDNTDLPSDLSSYDIKGNLLTQPLQSEVELQTLVDKSFSNILVYVEAAKLKNIVYDETQVQAAKTKYFTSVQDRLNVLGLNKKEEPTVELEQNESERKVIELKPDTNIKKAGFADILILTIIVLIYAAIIINLVSKLK